MGEPKIAGLSHLTLAVSDLGRSVSFYRDVLGLPLRCLWDEGAYFERGSLWLCLALDTEAVSARRSDYTHVALEVASEDFDALSARVRAAAPVWQENRSEGASLYFLDPDGHKLELHVGTLDTRLAAYLARPGLGREVFPRP
ncbi:MAG TPA: VOC family protein [Candidatus Methylacidiphilales bacterium]